MQVKVAEATLNTAQSTIKKLQDDLDYTTAVLDNAKKVYKRKQILIKNNVVSQTEYDKALENMRIAEANCNRAKSAIIEGQKKVQEAVNNINLRKAQLNYTRITVPFDGVIVFRAHDPGYVVVPGTPILSLVSTDVLWVSSWGGETELKKVEIGQLSEVFFRSSSSIKYPGKVVRLAKQVDTETREFIVDITLEKLPKH